MAQMLPVAKPDSEALEGQAGVGAAGWYRALGGPWVLEPGTAWPDPPAPLTRHSSLLAHSRLLPPRKHGKSDVRIPVKAKNVV